MAEDRRVRAGWLYRGRVRLDRWYGWYVPVMDKDGTFVLQDAYLLRMPRMNAGESKTDAAIRRCIELGASDHSFTLFDVRDSYYRGSDSQFRCPDGLLPDGFEPVCDLRGLRGLKPAEDVRFFEHDDVINGVRLYSEHGYSWNYGDIGVTLVKKGAEPSKRLVFEAEMDDAMRSLGFPRAGRTAPMEKRLESLVSEGFEPDEAQMDRFRFILGLSKRLGEMDGEIDGMCRAYSRMRTEKGWE